MPKGNIIRIPERLYASTDQTFHAGAVVFDQCAVRAGGVLSMKGEQAATIVTSYG
jgi:hypothetical protein